jgi:prevent-host-death family protein
VGVRELRQNLSVYLDRVKAGESLTVTEHGHVIATLGPASKTMTPLERLIAEGRATAATRSLRNLAPPGSTHQGTGTGARAVIAERERTP